MLSYEASCVRADIHFVSGNGDDTRQILRAKVSQDDAVVRVLLKPTLPFSGKASRLPPLDVSALTETKTQG